MIEMNLWKKLKSAQKENEDESQYRSRLKPEALKIIWYSNFHSSLFLINLEKKQEVFYGTSHVRLIESVKKMLMFSNKIFKIGPFKNYQLKKLFKKFKKFGNI